MSAWVALLSLANASTLPAMAAGMDNPVLNFAFWLSYYGLPVCLVLLVVLLILKQLKNKKLRDAAANAASDSSTPVSGTDVGNAATKSNSGTDVGNAATKSDSGSGVGDTITASSESSSQELVKEETSS